jgi:DNA polymerase-3 subunit epsilon
MTWRARLTQRKPELTEAQAAALRHYEATLAPDRRADIRHLRFVVVDVETTGLDPNRDHLLAIGAIAVEAMLIRFESSFSAFMRQNHASSIANILVHGIDGTTQANAPHAAEGLADFLRFAGKSPLVGFHSDFDRVVIERALKSQLAARLSNLWLDLARLAPAIVPDHAHVHTLDEWTRLFAIENYRRHDAVADALATAQLLQIVLARSAAARLTRLADLIDAADAQRWLERR